MDCFFQIVFICENKWIKNAQELSLKCAILNIQMIIAFFSDNEKYDCTGNCREFGVFQNFKLIMCWQKV